MSHRQNTEVKADNPKKINTILIVDIIIIFLCIVSDRLLKFYALTRLKDHPSKALINGIAELTYLGNSGASFGLLKGQTSFFILVSVVLLAVIAYLFFKMPGKKKYIKAHIALAFFAGGSVGNLIDRILYGEVIDYIYISLKRFPIFNLADIFITLSALFLVILFLFVYKESDLNFLRFYEKKIREL